MLYTGGGVMLYRVKFGRFRRNYRPSLVRRLETLHILQPISLPVTPLFPLSSWLIALSRVARITLPSPSRPHSPSSYQLPFFHGSSIRDFFQTLESFILDPLLLLSTSARRLEGGKYFSRHSRHDWKRCNDIGFWLDNRDIEKRYNSPLYGFCFFVFRMRTDLNNNLSQTVIIIELFFGYLDLVEIAREIYTKRRNSSVWSELHLGVENDFSRIETLRNNNVTRKEKKISRSA